MENDTLKDVASGKIYSLKPLGEVGVLFPLTEMKRRNHTRYGNVNRLVCGNQNITRNEVKSKTTAPHRMVGGAWTSKGTIDDSRD